MAAELAVSKTAGGESPGRGLGAGQEDPALPPLAVWPLLGVDSGLGRPLWQLEAVGAGWGGKERWVACLGVDQVEGLDTG